MLNKIKLVLTSLGIALLTPILVYANNTTTFESTFLSTKNPFSGVIVEYDLKASPDDVVSFQIRFKDKNKTTEWVDIEADIDGITESRNSDLINTNLTSEYQYRVSTNAGPDKIKPSIQNVKLSFINPKGDQSIVARIQSFASLAGFPDSNLKIISRSQWGAKDEYNYITKNNDASSNEDKSVVEEDDPEIQNEIKTEKGNDLKWPLQYIRDVRMIVVHHTASTSNLDNPKQALRNIQYYHAVSRKWGDIGYNYIIDQEGNIYEGRKGGSKVVGGHALPVNKTSVGISVLGNFESQKVPKAVVQAITKLSSELAELHNLDVTKNVEYKDKKYPVLSGHRDNSPTACPGKNLYQLLPTIRTLVASNIDLEADESSLANFNYAYVDQNSLRDSTEIITGEKKSIEIKLKNVGKKSWSNKETYLIPLNPTEFDSTIMVSNKDKIATLKEASVGPGKVGTFTINVTGGQKAGAVSLIAQGILNGEKKNSVPIFIPFNLTSSRYGYEIVGSKSLDLKLKKGESKSLTVNVKNTGDLNWNENFKLVRLGVFSPKDANSKLFENSNRIADFGTNEITPGETYQLTLNLKAPNEDITITESYAPVIDGLTWFDSGTPLTIKAVVGEGSRVPEKDSIELQSENPELLGPDIRINISNFQLNTAEVLNSKNVDLIIDNKSTASIKLNQKINITQDVQNIAVDVDGIKYSGKVVRLVSSSLDNIFTVQNYENRPEWNKTLNDNQFRGKAEFRIIDGGLRLINELPIEHYMRGVAEISNGTDSEKIKTIMVAARSYAYYHISVAPDRKFPGKGYNLDDSPDRTQKYLGYGFEKRSANVVKALQETAGKIVTFKGKSVVIPYFNNSDGKTRSAEEVWGWKDAPYVVSVSDSYCKTPNILLGHGVGISGCGATGMVEAGFKHEEIIKYYLTGVDFKIAYSDADRPQTNLESLFSDVNSKTQFANAIKFVKENGIVEGYPEGTYGPVKKINRAEFTKILIEAKFGNIAKNGKACFSDLKNNEWYVKYVCFAKEKNIISGYPDGTFKPAQDINVAEALKIVLETFYDNVPSVNGEWFAKYINLAKKDQLYISENWKTVSQNMNRAEMAELIFRLKNK